MDNNLGKSMDAQHMSGGKFFGSLPTEMMIKIIRSVGKIKNCHLVCRQFRQVCCAIEATKPNGVLMVLDDKKLKDLSILDSILRSERNVKYLKISSVYQTCAESESILKLRAVFKLFGKKLIGLTFFDCVFISMDLVRMLRKARNIKQFELGNMASLVLKPLKRSLTKGKKKLKPLEKFNNLESLTINYCDERILLKTYMMLRKHTLLNVSIGGPFRPVYIDFLVDKQNTLKKLTVAETNLNSTMSLMRYRPITDFHIKAPCFYVCKPQNISDFIINHPNLTSLDFESFEINIEILQEICKLSHLQKLKINIEKLCPDDMYKLGSLSSLREFAIINHCSFLSRRQFEAFTEIRNLKLTKFEMEQGSSSKETDLIRFAHNNPTLEHISIPCISKRVTEVFFEQCKMLKVFNCPGMYQAPCAYSNTTFSSEKTDNMYSTNLIELDSPYFKPCNNLYRNFPNLQKFKWYPFVIPSDEDFQRLLMHLKKIEHLEIMRSEKITKDSLESIKNYGKNLSYIKFNNLVKYLFWSDTVIDKFFVAHPQRIIVEEKLIRIVNYS